MTVISMTSFPVYSTNKNRIVIINSSVDECAKKPHDANTANIIAWIDTTCWMLYNYEIKPVVGDKF